MSILHIVGTRLNFVKAAAIIHAFKDRQTPLKLIHIMRRLDEIYLFFEKGKISESLKKIPGWGVLFIYFAISYSFPYLDGNEEHHFQYARQFIDPKWIPNSFVVTEFSATRWLFQFLLGNALKNFTFEQVAVGGRLLLALFFSIPISKILKYLRIPLIVFLVTFQFIYLPNQSFAGKEFIFLTVEAKTVAYGFAIWSVYNIFLSRYYMAAIMTSIATLFHLMVGGWLIIGVISVMLFYRVNLSVVLKCLLIYLTLVSPLLLVLLQSLVNSDNLISIEGSPSWTWIYVYYRNTHHLGIFKDIVFFLRNHSPGFFLATIAISLSVWLIRKKLLSINIERLVVLACFFLLVAFLFLFISIFDYDGKFLICYPFRLTSISALIFFLIGLYFFVNWSRHRNYLNRIKGILYLLLMPILILTVWEGHSLELDESDFSKPTNTMVELASFIKENTQKTDVFVMMPLGKNWSLDGKNGMIFSRLAERDPFVLYKFAPIDINKVYPWYNRLMQKEQLLSNWQHVFYLNTEYSVDYFIEYRQRNHPNLELIFTNEDYFLYKIN